MRAERIDPRTFTIEYEHPEFVVILFSSDQSGASSDEYRIAGATFDEAIAWAQGRADTFTVQVIVPPEHGQPEKALILLIGSDPNSRS